MCIGITSGGAGRRDVSRWIFWLFMSGWPGSWCAKLDRWRSLSSPAVWARPIFTGASILPRNMERKESSQPCVLCRDKESESPAGFGGPAGLSVLSLNKSERSL